MIGAAIDFMALHIRCSEDSAKRFAGHFPAAFVGIAQITDLGALVENWGLLSRGGPNQRLALDSMPLALSSTGPAKKSRDGSLA